MTTISNSKTYYHLGEGVENDYIESYAAKDKLLRDIQALGVRLPVNSLDLLIDQLGGPNNVAELTGRNGRMIRTNEGEIKYVSRAEPGISLDEINVKEKERFMNDQKKVAIISDAASIGISLQSSSKAVNQRRRVHITLELPWSAEKAVQQLGRTHRSNQVNAPHYIFLVSDLAGEKRFVASLAKRLQSLGALTHADRRAKETSNFAQFNIDNKLGREALQNVLKKVLVGDSESLPSPLEKSLTNMEITKEAIPSITVYRFLNRILGIPVELQNEVYDLVMNDLDEIINREKRAGRYDAGIVGKRNCFQ